MSLESNIADFVAPGPSADQGRGRTVFAQLREALSAGHVRAAEPDAASPSRWRSSTTGIYEGAVVKARAVIGAENVLTGSTPIYDLVRGEVLRPTPEQPRVIPEKAVVMPGARAGTVGKGPESGLALAPPVIVNRDPRTNTRTELEVWSR